jgi:hypothetical protein
MFTVILMKPYRLIFSLLIIVDRGGGSLLPYSEPSPKEVIAF